MYQSALEYQRASSAAQRFHSERHAGWARGIRVGSAKDGSVAAFIPDPDFDPKRSQETGAHGLAADARGAIYGAEVYSQSVKKYVR